MFNVVYGGLWWRRWWLGSLVVAAAMLLPFPCKDISPCVFSFYFFSFSSFLSLYSFVFFSFSPLFFFFLFFFSSSPPLLLFCSLFLYIYRQKHGERSLLPLSSHGTGVGRPGQQLCSCPGLPKRHVPSIFHPVVGHG